jgi:hypothetical protein
VEQFLHKIAINFGGAILLNNGFLKKLICKKTPGQFSPSSINSFFVLV